MYIYIYIYIYTYIIVLYHIIVLCYMIGQLVFQRVLVPASAKKTLLRRGGREEVLALETPNQGLESSFCCGTAGKRLTRRYYLSVATRKGCDVAPRSLKKRAA